MRVGVLAHGGKRIRIRCPRGHRGEGDGLPRPGGTAEQHCGTISVCNHPHPLRALTARLQVLGPAYAMPRLSMHWPFESAFPSWPASGRKTRGSYRR